MRAELLREVNDRIRELGDGVDFTDTGIEFICECGARDCMAKVALPTDEYDRLRLHPEPSIVAPGH